MYLYAHTYTHACIYTHTYTYMHVYTHIGGYCRFGQPVCVCVCVYIHPQTRVCVCVCAWVCMCVCVCMFVWIYICDVCLCRFGQPEKVHLQTVGGRWRYGNGGRVSCFLFFYFFVLSLICMQSWDKELFPADKVLFVYTQSRFCFSNAFFFRWVVWPIFTHIFTHMYVCIYSYVWPIHTHIFTHCMYWVVWPIYTNM